MAEEQPQAESENNGCPAAPSAPAETIVSKRQRRPSVRLGDIGEHAATVSYDSHARRSKQCHDYKQRKDYNIGAKSSRTRPLMNLGSAGEFHHETLDAEDGEGDFETSAIGSWRAMELKVKKGTIKRVRSNWVTKLDEQDEKFSGGENMNDEAQGSDSLLLKEPPSPNGSPENAGAAERRQSSEGLHGNDNKEAQWRPMNVSRPPQRDDFFEMEGPSDEWRRRASVERNRPPISDHGVKVWLHGLGLGRYEPVFEIHEVDDQVLPLLTLEDLRDMGITAVGSRRKMFRSIQKMGKKGFS